MKKHLLLCSAALLGAPAFGQNDECAGALALAAGTPTAFDTSAATVNAADPAWPCAAGGGPDIWYTFTTTQLADVEVSTCNNATYDTAVQIFSGGCGALTSLTCNDDGAGCAGFSSIATAVGVPAGTTLHIRIGGFNGATGAGTVTLTETAAFNCATVPDDAFEDNDTCLTASPLMAGSYPGLFASTSDADFYEITLGAADQLTFNIIDTPNEDLDLNLYDSSCNLIQFFNTDGLTYSAAGTAQTVIVEVFLDPGFSGIGCLNYDANVSVQTVPTCSTPDMFEDSDDCGTAAPIVNGTYTGLNVQDGDNDYYAVTVPNGNTLDVSILFTDAFADVDLYLWDPLVSCDTNVVGTGATTGFLARGFSASDNEAVSYTNNTGADQNLIIEVDMFSAGGCNDYDLVVAGAGVGGPGPIGTNYCATNPNSSGASGAISAFGETSVAANDVTLTASSLPANQFGIFITSSTTGFVPNAGGTSNGNLCLGGQIGRYVGPGQILSTGGMGTFSLALDLTAIPQGAGTVAAMAGTSRSWQAWHRDQVGLGSNFTDGITIGFTN